MTCKKKLIEVALPLEDINHEVALGKCISHGNRFSDLIPKAHNLDKL